MFNYRRFKWSTHSLGISQTANFKRSPKSWPRRCSWWLHKLFQPPLSTEKFVPIKSSFGVWRATPRTSTPEDSKLWSGLLMFRHGNGILRSVGLWSTTVSACSELPTISTLPAPFRSCYNRSPTVSSDRPDARNQPTSLFSARSILYLLFLYECFSWVHRPTDHMEYSGFLAN